MAGHFHHFSKTNSEHEATHHEMDETVLADRSTTVDTGRRGAVGDLRSNV